MTIIKQKLKHIEQLLHSYQFSRFKCFPKYEKKARVLKVFSAAEIFFSKPMLGPPNRPIHHFLKIFCLRLLANIIYLKFQPIDEGKIF